MISCKNRWKFVDEKVSSECNLDVMKCFQLNEKVLSLMTNIFTWIRHNPCDFVGIPRVTIIIFIPFFFFQVVNLGFLRWRWKLAILLCSRECESSAKKQNCPMWWICGSHTKLLYYMVCIMIYYYKRCLICKFLCFNIVWNHLQSRKTWTTIIS